MSTSQQVRIINQAFTNGLRHTLREKLHATYIYYLRRCSLPGRNSHLRHRLLRDSEE